MTKRVQNQMMVGATVLVSLALTVFIVIKLADWSSMTTAQQTVTVRLECHEGLKGLTTGSPIHIGGIKVGQITKAWISEDKACVGGKSPFRIMFTMKLPERFQLFQDCVLVPQSNMLGGQAMLSIENLGGQGTLIKSGEVVDIKLADNVMEALKKEFDPAKEDSLLGKLKGEFDRSKPESIMALLAATAANLKGISEKIESQVSATTGEKATLMTKLHGILDNLDTITEQLNNQLNTENNQAVIVKLSTALDDLNASLSRIKGMVANNEPKVDATLTSLQKVSATLEQDLPKITEKLLCDLDKVSESLDTAQATLVNLKEASTGIRDIIAVNQERIDRLIGDMGEVGSNIKLVSREIRRAPWKLLYKPSDKEQELQKVVDSAGLFAAGAERLNDAAIRLQGVLNKTGKTVADGEKIEQMMSELEASFSRFRDAEDKFWEDMK